MRIPIAQQVDSDATSAHPLGVFLRRPAYLLIAWFLFIGTGAAGFLHDLEHLAADARDLASHSGNAPVAPVHDNDNCSICVQLHLPMLSVGPAPLLLLIGGFVSLVIPHITSLLSQRTPLRIACRGPPMPLSILNCAA